MKRIAVVVLVILAMASSARAQELDIRVTANGQPAYYLGQQATISVYVWAPVYPGWDQSPWHQELVGEFRCPKEQTSTGATSQGCIGQYGEAYVYQTPNGTPLVGDRFYMVKVNAPGFRQAKAEWVFVPAGSYGLFDLDLTTPPVSVYSSAGVWQGKTVVYHYVFNNTQQQQRLRLETTLKAAGVTSKDNEVRGNTVFLNVPANQYQVFTENWTMPIAGQTYGEDNCVRAQITQRSAIVNNPGPGVPPPPTVGTPLVVESTACIANNAR